MSAVDNLNENTKEVFETAVRLLITVADNILNNPNDIKFRRLKLANKNVSEKLLPAIGAIECLFEMGFDEGDDSFVLAMSVPLYKVQAVRDKLAALQNKVNTQRPVQHQPTPLSQKSTQSAASTSSRKTAIEEIDDRQSYSVTTFSRITSAMSPPFLQEVESYAHQVLQYENKALQAKARAVVPVDELWAKAQSSLHNHQSEKVGVEEAEDQGLPDIMLYELLQWFKYEFFSWVDQPDCVQCGAKTQGMGMSSDPVHLKEAARTELYKCPAGHLTPFHRYSNAAKLLHTRRGRCGEWAQCFTLICRALDMDARLVHDETDHVWTEVWSATQNRWLHCDACEAILDAPLTYQAGWGKKLTYVIAFSRHEVQDVTWKYTQEPVSVVMQRRTKCTEQQLQNLLNVIRHRLQEKVTPTRRKFLQKRMVNELMTMIYVPGKDRVLKSTETQGRVSGSEAWRRERQEIGHKNSNWIWKPNKEELSAGHMIIKFSASQNLYVRDVNGESIKGWASGVNTSSNVTRKEERDWKMAYLARTEGSENGSLEWRVELPESAKIGQVDLNVMSAVYESGNVQWRICGEKPDICFAIPKGQNSFSTDQLSGCSAMTIKASLSGGNGSCAWQHTQISRQEMSDKSFPVQFKVQIRK